MSKYFIEDTTLTAIGDAIRDKAGTTELIKVSELADAIANIPTGGGGGDSGIPEEALNITGDCAYRFAQSGWNWFINLYGDKINTVNIDNCDSMFYFNTNIEEIPFEINLDSTGMNTSGFGSMFSYCYKLTSVPLIKGNLPVPTSAYVGVMRFASMFNQCNRLREIPEDYFWNFGGTAFWDKWKTLTSGSNTTNGMFNYCFSLRKIPDISMLKNGQSAYAQLYYSGFSNCAALDELTNLPVLNLIAYTSNIFISSFNYCSRLKNIIFETNEDGTPLTAHWKNQTITLSGINVGYTSNYADIVNYNSGITTDKRVYDDTTYQALKNDPDWFSSVREYSRYNHDSAVATINSLPDCSAYLATAGGTNTIKFEGAAGSATDGGAINTLTEEEIAVAAAKGWTVTLV